METCISTMLSPTKHFLHAENKQSLTFVPDQGVQHDCWSDSRLRSGTRKNKWPAWENGKFRWKSYGNSRGCRIPFSSYLRQDDASTSLCHHLPHPPIISSDFCPAEGSVCCCHQPIPPWLSPRAGRAAVGHLTSNGIPARAARGAWHPTAPEHLTLQTCRAEGVNV